MIHLALVILLSIPVILGLIFLYNGAIPNQHDDVVSIEKMVSIINAAAHELYVDEQKTGIEIYDELMEVANNQMKPRPFSWIPWFPNASLVEYGASCQAVAEDYL